MKKTVLITMVAVMALLTFSSVALANFGPHGSYDINTDACAGCHRAHTSFSTVTRDIGFGDVSSALLVSSASTMEEFCYACHGDGAPGASTNVQSGIFDAGPSGAEGDLIGATVSGVVIRYETDSVANSALNGGGFDRAYDNDTMLFETVTSEHDMDETGGYIDPMWGSGDSATASQYFTCTGCHDPHGATNYRLLRDSLTADSGGTHIVSNFVVSYEIGYPIGGWETGYLNADQGDGYMPNYTSTLYLFQEPDGTQERSISGWCVGCHERYIIKDDNAVGAGGYEYPVVASGDSRAALGEWAINSSTLITATIGSRDRHRHPVNTTVMSDESLAIETTTHADIPLEINSAGDAYSAGVAGWTVDDYFGCLTCHFAHGTSADMTGWAEASYDTSPSALVTWYPRLDPGAGGVQPNYTSALLRVDNRGVCERCHNK